MPEPHLLFISAGEHVHETLPACIKNLKEITHAIVVVEESVYHDLPVDAVQMKTVKPLIREAIQGVKAICDSMNIAFSEIRTEDTRINAIRDAVLAVTRQHPAARISFNLSGGTKMLSLSLFIMALWLDAEVYLTPKNDQIEQILIPQMHLDDIRRNPNYPKALEIISTASGRWVTRQDFAIEMEKNYKPSRFPGDEKTKRIPNRGTITRILQQLIDWDLVEESFCDRSKKAKQYCLTPHGEFAQKILRFEGGTDAPEHK
ncbi:hypothetical protein Metli_1294 [Methanofollis liminatans DSM 4140]|uniref:Uncharacterized protein n=1 Tax=Methanofollis liminatans DSM 4140 TaxID=28892 RepID=J1L3F2_9EURY|nr:hypothetical protein [Methanofollis liminatans]EJG07250.1 hypothetical protein Metli_1294 [Methanofollis liminatans DSM 4140]